MSVILVGGRLEPPRALQSRLSHVRGGQNENAAAEPCGRMAFVLLFPRKEQRRRPTAGDWGIKVEQIQPLSQAHEPCQDSHACVNHTPFHLSTGSGLPPALLGEFFQETL